MLCVYIYLDMLVFTCLQGNSAKYVLINLNMLVFAFSLGRYALCINISSHVRFRTFTR